MRPLRKIGCLLLAGTVLLSCDDSAREEIDSTPLVVEGWIDNGSAPVVLISRTIDPSESMKDEADILTKVVSYAKVRVSDGSRTVELKGERNDDYFPPYIYTTDEMIGETGKSYRLEVDYPGINAWAETSIPEPAELERFEVEVSSKTDSLYVLSAYIRNNPSKVSYYKFFTRVDGQGPCWNSSFLGLVDNRNYPDEVIAVPVARGWGLLEKYRQPLFRKGEKVEVKFCTVDETTYDYWKGYDDVTALARNVFFPVSKNIPGNVHGALGLWAGYGAGFYSVEIE